MNRQTIIFLLLCLTASASGQKPSIELTFTAIDSTYHKYLDSIKVINRTQGGDTILYYPDTVLILGYFTKIPETNDVDGYFQVFQNYPNPMADQTIIKMYIPKKDEVSITITDLLGQAIIRLDRVMDQGLHSFRFINGKGTLNIFTAKWKEYSNSIKIIRSDKSSAVLPSLEYIGVEFPIPQLKETLDMNSFPYSPGDELLYIGYNDTLQSGILDYPDTSKTYVFQFATNIPCIESPIVEYEGQVYNTIQIFSQCWLKENLNVGAMISGGTQTDNGIIEKYCFNNEPDSCSKYGGLYQWDEMMHYTFDQGVNGICPEGWHVPSDEDWKILEGAVDSFYPIGHSIWGSYTRDYRGTDCGYNLKSIDGWYLSMNGSDSFGFTSLPAGMRYDEVFESATYGSYYWTSTYHHNVWSYHRVFTYHSSGSYRSWLKYEINDAMSVRCLKD